MSTTARRLIPGTRGARITTARKASIRTANRLAEPACPPTASASLRRLGLRFGIRTLVRAAPARTAGAASAEPCTFLTPTTRSPMTGARGPAPRGAAAVQVRLPV